MQTAQRTHAARHDLEDLNPAWASRTGLWRWQAITCGGFVFMLAISAITVGPALLFAFATLISFVFFTGVLLRIVALAVIATTPHQHHGSVKEPKVWPSYAILMPLYREAEIVGDAVAALQRIDYPTDHLDIVLVCEADDDATLQAVRSAPLAAHMRMVVVPQSHPRTKPKALNFALTDVSAEYVVVYDAEDLPAQSQLRLAACEFARAGMNIGCLQARLNTYNPHDSFLTRQFTIEYSALFDGLLPALQFLKLPVPLGGTSNHFPTAVLRAVGAWDAFNVTEDADLGFRLARCGYRIGVLKSTTYEEAPARLSSWLPQRTRWLKGWLQTFSVLNRQPAKLLHDLGLYRFLGLQVLAGGLLAATFLHPATYVLAAIAVLAPQWIVPDTAGPFVVAAVMIAIVNVVGGFLATAALAATAVAGRGQFWLMPWIGLMPVYWLLVSYAAYRAAFQLARERTAPIRWEKTMHRPRRGSERAES